MLRKYSFKIYCIIFNFIRMKKLSIVFFVTTIVLLSCQPVNKPIDEVTYQKYISKGSEVAGIAQGVLLSNVGSAMSKGGPVYAVEFCNVKASSLIDSLNALHKCSIMRVTEKYRNPENIAKSEQEKILINRFGSGMSTDTLIRIADKLVYFKPIRTGMPACLQCHGKPGEDISSETLQKIREQYPDDHATGYGLNDFRGMWKIEFPVDF